MVRGIFFEAGGASSAAMREVDWRATALGPPEEWPASLLAQVHTMLHMRQPMCIFWGRELINLYNDGFLPILGEKHPHAMGRPAADVWQEAWEIVGPQLVEVMNGANMFHEEVVVPIARGGRVEDAWWNYSYSPLFDHDGNIGGVLVICTEVTKQVLSRRAEESGRKRIEELAVQQANARKQAETANRAKDEFLATVSHELRTPLTAILGWARILADAPDRARVEKGVAIIERNARAQAKIIDDILDVSRIISGKLQLVVRPVDVDAIVHSVVDSVRPAASAKEIELRIDVNVRTPLVADEDRLHQVIWNLLSNAVKFTPRGGTVTIRAHEDDHRISIVVSDTGRGISAAFLPHVFDRFRQADASTTKQHAGLGLGLAIVRHLVELHGGSVSAHSDGEGKGAQFEVVFPLRAERTEARESSVAPPSDGNRDLSNARLKGVRVLVVDDQTDARELVAVVLEDAGAEVVQAGSAAAAVDLLANGDFSAIVSDIGMPDVDGYAFLEKLRATPRTQAVPALALTAYARLEDRERALLSGFQNHIAKPIDPAKLVAGVAALVRPTKE